MTRQRKPRIGCVGLRVAVLAHFAVSLPSAIAAPDDRATPPSQKSQFGVIGGEKILWVFHRRVELDEMPVLRFAFRRASRRPGDRFYRPTAPLMGSVSDGVVRDATLHVFFGDGTHRRLSPEIPTSGARPRWRPFVEVNLPGQAVPIAPAWDSESGNLLAIVTASQAEELTPDQEDQPDIEGATVDEETEPLQLPTTALPSNAASACVLLRYENGKWYRNRAGPTDLADVAQVAAMLTRGGRVHLICRFDQDSPVYTHTISPAVDADWALAAAIPLASNESILTGLWSGEDPVLVIGRGGSEATEIRSLRFTGDSWEDGPHLLDASGGHQSFGGVVSATQFGGDVAVATLNADKQVQVGRWSLQTGEPVEPSRVVRPLLPLPRPMIHAKGRRMIQFGILAGVLGGVLVWRRDGVLRANTLAPGQAPARLALRALALLLDAAILLPIWAPVLYWIWFRAGTGFTVQDYLRLGPDEMPEGMFWSSAILGGIFGIYGTIFEALTRSTPGKRIAGLRVVAEGGERCGLGAILIRNMMRTIEFKFPPIVLLIAFTPARQRLGDLFARTVVVTTVETPP